MMETRTSPRLTSTAWINAILASGMAACLAASAGRIGEAIRPPLASYWQGAPLLLAGIAFLVAMEVQLSRRLREQHATFSRESLSASLVEWTLLLLGLVLVTWLSRGWEYTWQEIRALPGGIHTVLLKREYLEGFLVLVLAWGSSRILAGELIALEEKPMPSRREAELDPMGAQLRARDRLWEHSFLFGAAVIFFSLVIPPILRSLLNHPAIPAGVGWEVMAYFLCSLVLLTIGRLLLLSADWAWEQTPILSGLPRRWILSSLVFLSLVILLAGVLPTDFSFNLLIILGAVLQGILEVVIRIGGFLYLYIILPLLGLIASIFSILHAPEAVSDSAPMVVPPALPQIDWSWVPILRELLLWILIIAVLIFTLREVLRGRQHLLRGILRRPGGRRLLSFWRGFWRRLTDFPRRAATVMRASWQNTTMAVAARANRMDFGFLRLRELGDRALIRFYFLALVRRATERGFPRKPAQTPREYVAGLMEVNPPVQGELQEMVLAFEEARYSEHNPGRGRVLRVRKVWDTIRSQIRGRKK